MTRVPNPSGVCLCGCGEATNPDDRGGYYRYRIGHHLRRSPHDYAVDENGCWIWQRTLSNTGYGQVRISGKLLLAHRVYYEREHGAIGAGLEVDHLCRVPACVNPAHLEAVTPATNSRRSRKTKLTVEQVLEIRAAADQPYTALARRYGVTGTCIRSIVTEQNWRGVEA